MIKVNTVNTSSTNRVLMPTVEKNKLVTVVTTIITTVTAAKCKLLLYNSNGGLQHTMSFQPPATETVFIDSKIFLPQGYSLRCQSEVNDTTFTIMYDQSQNY